MKQDLNWEDPRLKRWLGTIIKAGTLYNYRSAFRIYHEYTGLTATQLIDEALEDQKRDIREKKDVVLTRIINFYKYLKTDYEKKSRGMGKHRVIGKGVSDKLANMYVSAIRSFYSTFEIYVRLKGRTSLPKPKIKNKRMKVGSEQVKTLIDHARTPRDRAIILTMFQSGMDVSTLCSLTYNHIKEGIENKEHPLKLDLYRPKTGVEYYTFLGKDAIEAIRAYLSDAERRGIKFRNDMPLFIKRRKIKGELQGLDTQNVQDMMREVAIKSPYVDKEMNGKAFNPLSPHALRESFGSIMINSGVPDTIVDFWLGHTIGQMGEAYKTVQFDSLKKMYLEKEKILSVSQGLLDAEEIEKRVDIKVDNKISSLQKVISNYATENLELKSRMSRLELEIMEIKKLLSKHIEF